MRVADIVIAFPSLLLAMVIMYTLGAGLSNIFMPLASLGGQRLRSGAIAGAVAQRTGVRRGRQGDGREEARYHGKAHIPQLPALAGCAFTLKVPEFILGGQPFVLGSWGTAASPELGLLVAGKEFIFCAVGCRLPWRGDLLVALA